MSLNKKILVTVAAGLALSVSSCRKYLDVNTNPNIATSGTVQTLLTASQLKLGSAMGVDLQINGGMWAGYWTQSPNASQYRSLEQYAPGQDAYSTSWENLYYANENLYQLAKLADTQNKKHYKALSLLLRAYSFHVLTDGWGDVPFREALKAQPSEGGFLNPKYDSQLVVYNGLIAYIDSAQKLLAMSDGVNPGSDDLIYHGDLTRWVKFGNTLKLKIYLRMSERNPVAAQAGIANLYATAGGNFIGIGDDAFIGYGYSSTNKSPLYAEASSTTLGSIQNLVGSNTAIDSMNNNDDYRAYVFYTTTSTGAIKGIPQGAYDVNVAAGTYSIPNVYVAGDAQNVASANAPVNFLTSYESYFLQAEAAARGWATGNDSILFYKGIEANFNYYNAQMTNEIGVDGATAYDIYINGDVANSIPPGYWAVYPSTGTVTDKIRHIITGKWFSMCGNQGFEAWTELRRTGYPDFFVPSKNSMIGASVPSRFLYPTSESTRNASFPGLAPVTTRMWWDL